MTNPRHSGVTEHYRTLVEAAGYSWAEYADCDHWTLSMLFDTWEEEDEGDYL